VRLIKAVLESSDADVPLVADFETRVSVLMDLKYINDERTVQLKGRVACEISTADALVLTEFLFENVIALLGRF
jgi:antiviral helicase SKI2